MVSKISKLIKESSKSILTYDEKSSIRGGAGSAGFTKKDENSDSNGDGVADDCNEDYEDLMKDIRKKK